MSGLQLTMEQREAIIGDVIRRARPRWWQWPFDWFNICPVDAAARLFEIDWQGRNSAYLLLLNYHCVGYWHIPCEIRRRMPDLIREALSSKVRMFCEIEEARDVDGLKWENRRLKRRLGA